MHNFKPVSDEILSPEFVDSSEPTARHPLLHAGLLHLCVCRPQPGQLKLHAPEAKTGQIGFKLFLKVIVEPVVFPEPGLKLFLCGIRQF
jgi:hypothetical protein